MKTVMQSLSRNNVGRKPCRGLDTHSGRQSARHAFTLIELLVVIAIISILMGMVMTAISRAKNKASQVVDINNLKQMVTTLHMFSTDNEDNLPWPNWKDGDRPDRQGWLYTLDDTATGPARFKVQTGSFWETLRNPKLYYCPMDKPESHTDREQQISSYVMNGAVIGFDRMRFPSVRSSLMKPEDVAFWETDERHADFFNDGASYPEEGVSRRHNQGAIRVTFSGTVGFVRFDTWYEQVEETHRNNLWCYPGSEDGR